MCVLNMFWCSGQFCIVLLHSSALLSQSQWGAANTTGPLAEAEARGQRAAAKSDPEELNSVAVKIRKILFRKYSNHRVKANIFIMFVSCFAFSCSKVIYIFINCHSSVTHTQISCWTVKINASQAVCMCVCSMYSGSHYMCVICLLMCMAVCSAACRSSYKSHGSICLLILMRNARDSWSRRFSCNHGLNALNLFGI